MFSNNFNYLRVTIGDYQPCLLKNFCYEPEDFVVYVIFNEGNTEILSFFIE